MYSKFLIGWVVVQYHLEILSLKPRPSSPRSYLAALEKNRRGRSGFEAKRYCTDSRVKEPACLRVNPRYCGGISHISRLFSRVIAPFTAKIPPNTASLPSDKLHERV